MSDSEMEHLSLNLSVSVVRSILSLARVPVLLSIVVFALLAGENARATTIGINLGSSPRITSEVTVSVDALNGVSLNGQTLSLNFMFTNSEFVRLFTATSASFAASLNLQTNGSGLVGFLSGTGELLDQQGNALQTPQNLGSASRDDGSMFAALFPLSSGQLHKPLDFFGIHYDLTLPTNSSVAVIGAEFQLI